MAVVGGSVNWSGGLLDSCWRVFLVVGRESVDWLEGFSGSYQRESVNPP